MGGLYQFLLVIALLCYLPAAVWRRRLPHRGWSMRLGRYPRQVTEWVRGRRPVWVHAVSVGEVLSARPLIEQLVESAPADGVVLSTVTSGGFGVASPYVSGRGVAVYFPLDFSWCVRRAFDTLHPRALLLVESELWPIAIQQAKASGLPVIIVNGRISSRACTRYLWVKPWLHRVLQQIDLFLMQSQLDADRVLQLGAPAERVRVVGSLKWDASLGSRPTAQAMQQAASRLGINGQQLIIVAGSTHRGEEQAILDAFRAIRTIRTDARLLIAPRHLERLGEVEGLVRHHGLLLTRTSQPTTTWDVGLVDAFGQLPTYYGLATLTFVGGSLIPHGGQNPLEATSLGKPVIFGPFTHNFATIVHQLLAHHAARQVQNAKELVQLVEELVTHPAEAHAMGQRARAVTEQFQGATQRTLTALQPFLKL